MTIQLVPRGPAGLPLELECTPAERDPDINPEGEIPFIPDLEPESLPLAEAFEPVKLEKTGIKPQIPGELFSELELLAETVATKLDKVEMPDEAAKIRNCCQHVTVRTCKGCLDKRCLVNHCDVFYCPKCQSRIARRRKSTVQWWTKLVRQPKHVVLTIRNAERLTDYYIAACKDALRKLRRSKCARGWRGGCWSLEITNEGRGWHVHFHLLVDANWIDTNALATRWAALVHQDFAIVKVKDVRQSDYLREILKYVAKGSVIASWPAEQLSDFIHSLTGARTFGVFGTLHGAQADWRRAVESMNDANHKCPCCGHTDFQYLDANEHEWRQHINGFA